MKKHILYFTSLIIASSCSEAIKKPDLNSELEKWKLEMQSNGIVGPPCIEDYEKWSIENPNDYYGLQDVTTLEDDFNSDGIKDALFYFPAVNCVGGNGYDSDFAVLVYSKKGTLLTNNFIVEKIESKLSSSLRHMGFLGDLNIHIHFEKFRKKIFGKYYAWGEEDANCCPSNSGKFEYDPMNNSILIRNESKKH